MHALSHPLLAALRCVFFVFFWYYIFRRCQAGSADNQRVQLVLVAAHRSPRDEGCHCGSSIGHDLAAFHCGAVTRPGLLLLGQWQLGRARERVSISPWKG